MSFKVLQITDSHLLATETLLRGVNTRRILTSCLDKIDDAIDAIFLTGDVSEDGSPASYHYAAKALSTVNCHVYWIPGNHDTLHVMRDVFAQYPLFSWPSFLVLNHWRFIFLNSTIDGTNDGLLADDQLIILQEQLQQATQLKQQLVLVMHHHPLKVGQQGVDGCMLRNSDAVLALLAQHACAKLVICGHVHGDYTLPYQHLTLETGPSACFQWRPGDVLDSQYGYKVYDFSDDYQARAYFFR